MDKNVLLDHADVATQGGKRKSPQIMTVDQDLALGHVVEARD